MSINFAKLHDQVNHFIASSWMVHSHTYGSLEISTSLAFKSSISSRSSKLPIIIWPPTHCIQYIFFSSKEKKYSAPNPRIATSAEPHTHTHTPKPLRSSNSPAHVEETPRCAISSEKYTHAAVRVKHASPSNPSVAPCPTTHDSQHWTTTRPWPLAERCWAKTYDSIAINRVCDECEGLLLRQLREWYYYYYLGRWYISKWGWRWGRRRTLRLERKWRRAGQVKEGDYCWYCE